MTRDIVRHPSGRDLPIAVNRELGLDPDRVNTRDGAVALGHPIGASGARILTTLIHSLIDLDTKSGVASLCIEEGEVVAMWNECSGGLGIQPARHKEFTFIDQGAGNSLVDQREELPLLPLGNPTGNVPTASRRAS